MAELRTAAASSCLPGLASNRTISPAVATDTLFLGTAGRCDPTWPLTNAGSRRDMETDRRSFVKAAGIATVACGAMSASGLASTLQTRTPFSNIKALAFDAYGTLFDVFSVTALCEALFPGNGTALAQLWRAKQLQYSLLRSLMGRYENFWRLTEDGLLYASKSLKLDLTSAKQQQLMNAYLTLTAFPDVKPGLRR